MFIWLMIRVTFSVHINMVMEPSGSVKYRDCTAKGLSYSQERLRSVEEALLAACFMLVSHCLTLKIGAIYSSEGVGIAQYVQRWATGWTAEIRFKARSSFLSFPQRPDRL
jgi:hypothetical protein